MIVTTEGITLRKKRFGDSSLISTIYTKDYGKVSIIAKGALRPKSKFAYPLMPLQHIALSYYKKKNGLGTASDAESLTLFYNIQNSYEQLTIGLALVETVDLKSEDEGADHRLYAMLLHSIKMLDGEMQNPKNLFLLFQFHFATLSGFKIDIKYLPEVDEDFEPHTLNQLAFYHDEGRVRHYGNTTGYNSFSLNRETFYILRELVATGFDECGKVEITDSQFNELVRFFASYFSHHLEQKVEYKTLSLI